MSHLRPSQCSHPELVGPKEMVYGTSTWPLAGEMRVTGGCGDEGKLFEAKKKKTLTEWIFG